MVNTEEGFSSQSSSQTRIYENGSSKSKVDRNALNKLYQQVIENDLEVEYTGGSLSTSERSLLTSSTTTVNSDVVAINISSFLQCLEPCEIFSPDFLRRGGKDNSLNDDYLQSRSRFEGSIVDEHGETFPSVTEESTSPNEHRVLLML